MMQNLANGLLNNDSLLVGFDLVKPKSVLHAAYNNSEGITKAFNLNILNVVNRIIESDFDLHDFDHHSFFNHEKLRIEMHLHAKRNCVVSSPFFKQSIRFKKEDSIRTENSHKFTSELIQQLAENTNLQIKNFYTDKKEWFALVEFARR
jgi:L-histidine N-alpha-methyltransferase